jgi:hypothetical protein
MTGSTFQSALSELEGLARSQTETETREDWSASLLRLQDEERALSRLLAAALPSPIAGRKQIPPEMGARLDALLASYGDRIARIERHKLENRQELASLGGNREFAVSALQRYCRSEC